MRGTFSGPDQWVFALRESPGVPFSLEAGGAQTAGEPGLALGLAFGYSDRQNFVAVLLNNNGYAQAFARAGGAVREWFPFGQWPHILSLEANRVRLEVSADGEAVVRINDEVLTKFRAAEFAALKGKVGVAARANAAGQVLFNWVKVWSR